MNYKTKKCKFPPLSFLYFLKGEDRTCKMHVKYGKKMLFNFDSNEVLDPVQNIHIQHMTFSCFSFQHHCLGCTTS